MSVLLDILNYASILEIVQKGESDYTTRIMINVCLKGLVCTFL